MPRIKRDVEKSGIFWILGSVAVIGVVTVIAALAPLAALLLLASGLFIWSFAWKVPAFFAAHFALTVGALMAVPVLRLTAAENTLRLAVPVIVVVSSLAVAVRIKGSPTRGLVPGLLVFFTLALISTSFVEDPNEWSFFALEVVVAFSAVIFAKAAAKIEAWPTVARVIIVATAAEASIGIYEVFQLSGPIWRGGRILSDGSSAWIRNEVVPGMPRAQGTFGHPLPFAFSLIVGALLILRTKIWSVLVRSTLFCLLAAGVFVSGSRNAIILFAVVTMVAFILPSLIPRLHMVGTMAFVGLAIVFPYLLGKFDELMGSGSVDHRLGALKAVDNLLNARAFSTVLFGDGSAAAPRLFATGLLQNDGFAAVDNQYVLTIAQNGVVGLLFLIVFLWTALRRASATLRIMLLAVVITGMIFDLFAWPAIGFTVWFLIASAFARMPGTNLASTPDLASPQDNNGEVSADPHVGPGPWKQGMLATKKGNGLVRNR